MIQLAVQVSSILTFLHYSLSPIHSLAFLQSFADLWVDFLLKETDDKERREHLEQVADPSSAVSNSTIRDSTPSVVSTGSVFSRFS